MKTSRAKNEKINSGFDPKEYGPKNLEYLRYYQKMRENAEKQAQDNIERLYPNLESSEALLEKRKERLHSLYEPENFSSEKNYHQEDNQRFEDIDIYIQKNANINSKFQQILIKLKKLVKDFKVSTFSETKAEVEKILSTTARLHMASVINKKFIIARFFEKVVDKIWQILGIKRDDVKNRHVEIQQIYQDLLKIEDEFIAYSQQINTVMTSPYAANHVQNLNHSQEGPSLNFV